jgi:hypothetical protein
VPDFGASVGGVVLSGIGSLWFPVLGRDGTVPSPQCKNAIARARPSCKISLTDERCAATLGQCLLEKWHCRLAECDLDDTC